MQKRHSVAQRVAPTAIAFVCWTFGSCAIAAELANNDSYTIRWDNSLKYTLGARTSDPSPYFLSNPNTNDGDGAFRKNDLVSNRVDLLSEFDLVFKDAANSGVRVSAAAWHDSVYRRSHEPLNPATYNPTSVSNDQFTPYARKWAGGNSEIYDAFVHSGFDLDGHNVSFRLGRHTLTWGESLMLASNGVAGGQAPVDVHKVLTVPGIQAKDFLMPVNQLSGAVSLNDNWDLAGYYQLEFRPTRLMAPGTFLSPADVVYDGAERLFVGPGFAVPRTASLLPPERKGQWGISAKYRNPASSWDFGAYYLRYTDKTPQLYMGLGNTFTPSNYFFVYPQNIELFGLSTSTHVGNANVAAEVSVRNNTPLTSLASALVVIPGVNDSADGRSNPLYAVGRSLHVQASTIWQVPRTSLWETATLVGEIGANTLLKTTRNAAARDTNTSRTALMLAAQFEPGWYQALPNVDISIPLTVSYNFNSKTPAVAGPGGARGGNLAIGVKFTYANNLKGGLTFTKYLGADNKNAFADRDFVAFNLLYSF